MDVRKCGVAETYAHTRKAGKNTENNYGYDKGGNGSKEKSKRRRNNRFRGVSNFAEEVDANYDDNSCWECNYRNY